MPEPLVIWFPVLPPKECAGNSRAHWTTKKRAVDAWSVVAKASINSQMPKGYKLPLAPLVEASVTVTIPRRKWRRRDRDNFAIQLKPLWDLLVHMGILKDDRSEWFKPYPPEFVKADVDQECMTLVIGSRGGD